MSDNQTIMLKKGEGDSFWVLGDLYTFKLTGKQTQGAFTVMDQIIQPQGGPPPHVHRSEDETFFVVDGKFSFLCGENETVCEEGSFVYVPKGTLHTFKNISEKPGRLLVTITPAGLEDFFFAIGTSTLNSKEPPPFDPSIIDKLLRLAGQYDMEIVLPDM